MNTHDLFRLKPQFRPAAFTLRFHIILGLWLAGVALTWQTGAASMDPEISRTLRSLAARQREQVALSKKYSVFTDSSSPMSWQHPASHSTITLLTTAGGT